MNTDIDRLYYDGSCPLCRREMNHLSAVAGPGLQLVDISRLEAPEPGCPDLETLARRLHLRRADGTWVRGLEANVAAWSHSRYGPLWKLLLNPLIKPLAVWLYEDWARRRYRARCSTQGCRLPPS